FQCTHAPVADGTSCSDGNACNGAETCQSGACAPGTPVTCAASDSCHVAGTCDPATVLSSTRPAPDGTACSDGNPRTENDRCTSGVCGGAASVCTPSDRCHSSGTCAPATGLCTNPPVPDGRACFAGNPCTTGDTCQGGACVPGAPVTCTALDSCHVAGTCDPT